MRGVTTTVTPLLHNCLNIQAKHKFESPKRTKAVTIIFIQSLLEMKSSFYIVPTVYLAGRQFLRGTVSELSLGARIFRLYKGSWEK